MQKQNKGFSFIEIIVVISILVLLAFIGLNTQNSWNEKTDNTKTVSDLSTINNALTLYINSKKDLPIPGGNNYIYNSEGGYSHDWSNTDTFGVSGFITENILPKSFMNFLPTDGRTKQYYGYARKKTTLSYQVAGIIWENGEPKSSILGNYLQSNGIVDLVKEYNGPNFIYNDSKENFPFSPDERELTARIYDYTGSISINGKNLGLTGTLDYILREGDKVSTTVSSYATIYYSDGSKSVLGNDVDSSDLTLSTMKYEGENNLITKVKLALGGGTVWNNITKLNNDGSQFEVSTNDVIAAVRGTEFGVRKDTSKTNVTLKSGKVSLIDKTNTEIKKLELGTGETSTGSNITNGSNLIPGTGALDNLNNNYFESDNVILNGLVPKVISWNYTGSTDFEIKLNLNNSFKKADDLKIKNGNSSGFITNYWKNNIALVLTGGTTSTSLNSLFSKDIINISFCKNTKKGKKCSKEVKINLAINSFNQDNNDLSDQIVFKDKPNCAKGFDLIDGYTENNGCVENSLYKDKWKVVAYAPYNRPGDLTMYKYKEDIQASSSGVLNNNINFSTNCNFSDALSSFCEDKDGNKGIFFNGSTSKYLKYDFSDLNLGEDFAIEINAKINYSNLTKYLIDNPNLQVRYTYDTSDSKTKLKINNNFIDNTTINNSGFKKIIIQIKDKKVVKVIINNEEQNLPNNNIINSNIYNFGSYINTNGSYTNFLNNIIDYIKIYKN